ncbi:MAG: hypothetical protein ACXVRK_09170 [Gaiellaceae bacterium]
MRTLPDDIPDLHHKHLNPMAAASPLPHDYSTDWVAELQRLAAQSVSLPTAAHLAVLATIEAIEAEDGFLPQPALQARVLLVESTAQPRGHPHRELLPRISARPPVLS